MTTKSQDLGKAADQAATSMERMRDQLTRVPPEFTRALFKYNDARWREEMAYAHVRLAIEHVCRALGEAFVDDLLDDRALFDVLERLMKIRDAQRPAR